MHLGQESAIYIISVLNAHRWFVPVSHWCCLIYTRESEKLTILDIRECKTNSSFIQENIRESEKAWGSRIPGWRVREFSDVDFQIEQHHCSSHSDLKFILTKKVLPTCFSSHGRCLQVICSGRSLFPQLTNLLKPPKRAPLADSGLRSGGGGQKHGGLGGQN